MKNKQKNLLFYFLFTILSIFIFLVSTPQVFASTEVTEDITADTTWTLAESPYIMRDIIYVDTDVTLTIEPGTIVKFYNGSIVVLGKLMAEGNIDNLIHFTSIKDDSIGGDTNMDGNATTPDVGDWHTIIFENAGGEVVNFNYVSIKYSTYPINIEKCGSGKIENTSVSYSDVGIVLNKCHNLTLNTIDMDHLHDGIIVDGKVDVTIDGLKVSDVLDSAVVIWPPFTHVSINNFEFKNGPSNGLWVKSISTLALSNGIIENFDQNGIYCFGWDTFNPGVTITNVTIKNNGSNGIYSSGCNLSVTNSLIKDNTDYTILSEDATHIVNAINNYWGDASGPYNETSNPEGLGDIVSDNIDFTPWLTTEPGVEEEVTRDPVIIIPGITGSYINKNYGDSGEIWPNANTLVTSLTDNFLDDLALNPDGTEKAEFPMTVGDIIRKVDVEILGQDISSSHVFDNMISDLEKAGYVEGVDLFVFPYDWRYSTAVGASQLAEKIDEALDISLADRVDIISHSMGGIVAKKYIADNGKDKIDQLIFLGTPHLGSPKAFKALTWGDDLGYSKYGFPFLTQSEVKFISQNFPSMFELLPSIEYVNDKFSKYMTDATGKYIDLSLNYSDTKDLMIENGRNDSLFAGAESIHTDTDNIDLSGIKVSNFTGCSIATPGKFTITRHTPKKVLGITIVKGYDITYIDGDQTVPILSSRDELGGGQYFVKGTSHGSLPNDDSVRAMILSLLGGNTVAEYDNIVTQDQCGITGTKISVHSPVSLNIYDENNNHTGPSFDSAQDTSGDVEYNIPDTQYDVINDEKFAFLPAGSNYTVSLNAENLGVYDLYIENIVNGVTTSTRYWNEVPINSLNMRSRVQIGSNIEDVVIEVDEDGDGAFEKSVSPSSVLDQGESVDLVSPESKGEILDGKIVLSANDDNSGVLKTEYSVDGENWIKYTEPVANTHPSTSLRVEYYSTDKAGNVEETKEITLPKKVVVNNKTGSRFTPPGPPKGEEGIQNAQELYYPPENLSRVSSREGNAGGLLSGIKNALSSNSFQKTEDTTPPTYPYQGSKEFQTASASNSTSKTPSTKVLLGVFAGAVALGYVAKRFIKL